MRCGNCTVENDVHEIGCKNRLGTELYRTETAAERATLEALLIDLLDAAGLYDDFDADNVEADEETWEYARQAIRDGRTPTDLRITYDEASTDYPPPWMERAATKLTADPPSGVPALRQGEREAIKDPALDND